MSDELQGDGTRREMDKSASKGIAPGPTTGTVKSYNAKRNPFGGYITCSQTGVDVFVHKTAVEEAGLGKLSVGDEVAFDVVEDGFGGVKATKLKAGG